MDPIQSHHFTAFAQACGIASSQEAFLAGWDACKRHHDGMPATVGPKDDIAEAIYQAYPRHIAKGAALKAIRNAIKPDRGAFILARTKAFAEAVERWPWADRQFIPHPATWFNRESYDDDPKEWQRGSGNVGLRISE